jgi:hypothetical protein
MRAFPTVIGVVLLAGCAGGALPNRFSGPAGSGGQALTCITQRLGTMGYSQVGGGANAGTVRLERINDDPWWLEVIGFNDSVDVVDVTSQGGQLQMTVYSQVIEAGERSAAAPDQEARSQAREVFTGCST